MGDGKAQRALRSSRARGMNAVQTCVRKERGAGSSEGTSAELAAQRDRPRRATERRWVTDLLVTTLSLVVVGGGVGRLADGR